MLLCIYLLFAYIYLLLDIIICLLLHIIICVYRWWRRCVVVHMSGGLGRGVGGVEFTCLSGCFTGVFFVCFFVNFFLVRRDNVKYAEGAVFSSFYGDDVC